jgi:thioredoxin-dependent peroxiredoxin
MNAETMVGEGDAAPDFSGPRDGGGALSAADCAGRIVVLYFYPKDDTSGCTREAVEFTERLADFEAAGAMVIGVSKDSVKKHDKFRDKHALGVALISDENSDICERYGVWREKNMYGKKYMGVERSTFLIRDGAIVKAWRKVSVPGHVEAVLEAARALQG